MTQMFDSGFLEYRTAMTDAAHMHAEAHGSNSIKETVISILIAFAMAFVFRGFVIEPFLIPTGSMAPTLMGAHIRITDAQNGYSWPAGPHVYVNNDFQNPPAAQTNIVCAEPMTAQRLEIPVLERRGGDRIFVLKMPYSLVDPQRYEVIVFRNPHDANENYIKRMIGSGNEHVAIVDGDVFARPIDDAHPMLFQEQDAWSAEGWRIQRKPEHVQRAVWQPVFDSVFTPVNATRDGRRIFRSPWVGVDAGQTATPSPNWKIADTHQYRYSAATPTTLRFLPQGLGDSGGWLSELYRASSRPPIPPFISDFTSYNDNPRSGSAIFPVSDIRLIADVKPDADGVSWSGVIRSRGRDFRASLKPDGSATLEVINGENVEKSATAQVPGAMKKDAVTQIEFWHADQSLQLFISGKKVCELDYDWTPTDRTLACFGLSAAQIARNEPNALRPAGPSVLQKWDSYPKPEVWMEFSGGAFTLERAAIARDIHYQAPWRAGTPYPLGTHPLRVVTLSKDQFFMCGDNSPASLDGRLWDSVDPWVADKVGNDIGVVHRDLLIGKAFFVYFPSLGKSSGVPVPDFGRMRYIW